MGKRKVKAYMRGRVRTPVFRQNGRIAILHSRRLPAG